MWVPFRAWWTQRWSVETLELARCLEQLFLPRKSPSGRVNCAQQSTGWPRRRSRTGSSHASREVGPGLLPGDGSPARTLLQLRPLQDSIEMLVVEKLDGEGAAPFGVGSDRDACA